MSVNEKDTNEQSSAPPPPAEEPAPVDEPEGLSAPPDEAAKAETEGPPAAGEQPPQAGSERREPEATERPRPEDRQGEARRPRERDGGGDRRRRPFRRRRVCIFCVDKASSIDYKDPVKLRRFLSDRARIDSRRKTGTCAKHQRWLAVALKRARHLALLPYTPEHIRVTGVFPSRR